MSLEKIQAQVIAALVEAGRLAEDARIELATAPEEFTGEALDRVLTETHGVTAFQLQLAKCRAFRIAPYNVARFRLHPGVFARLEEAFCKENLVLPVGEIGDLLLIVIANPFDVSLANKIQEMTGKRVIRLLGRGKDLKDKFTKPADVDANFSDVVNAFGSEYGTGAGDEEDLTNEESGPIIDLANRIIEDAYFNDTSDIQVEPWEKEVVVRNRIDGVCREKLRLPGKVGPALVARLKIMCNLDIAERRLAQDGRIVFKQYSKRGLDVDLRVSTAPLNNSEGVVMRILDK